MRYVYAVAMLVFSVLSFYYATRVFFHQNYKKVVHRAFSATAFGSGAWGLGYGLMFMTEDEATFLKARAIGIWGLVLFLIATQILIYIVGEFSKKLLYTIIVEVIAGTAVLLLVIQPGQVTMTHTENGITTAFVQNWLSITYTLYTVVVAIIFVTISILLTRGKNKHSVQAFGKKLLIVEALILVGMFIDTVLPALGINKNIPASTLIQFIGLQIVYFSLIRFDQNQIGFQNMAGYINTSLRTPILILDTNNKICACNRAACNYLELAENGDYSGIDFWKNYLDMQAPEEIAQSTKTIVISGYYAQKKRNCNIYVDPILNDYHDYTGYILSIADITTQMQSMKELELAKEEAQRANRAKTVFLTNMSHEIRTPMNAILGFSNLATQEKIDPLSREYFGYIKEAADALLVTINSILDISKIESGKAELVCADYNPGKMFSEVANLIQVQAAKKNLDFHMEVPGYLPEICYGDGGKVREILINLCNNAVKYTRTGSILLKISIIKRYNDMIRLRFEVKDTGIGIKAEDIPYIFDSFQRVDGNANRATEGSGLGLSITKGIVDLMGGEISVSSEYGSGSTFTVDIDQKVVVNIRIEKDTTATTAAAQTAEEAYREKIKNLRVLAVDDNDMNLVLISMIFKKYGIELETCTTGEESIELCKVNDYDLVLMDQMMPQMDGTEAMRGIRKLFRGYEKGGPRKIIVLTANEVDGVKEELLAMGFDAFLGKPIDFKLLDQTLMKLVR